MQYRAAVRHLRRSEYEQAIALMDHLISAEPDDPGHYRFRAELHHIAGDLARAQDDYEQVVRLAPGLPDGYLGLAEIFAQGEDYRSAHRYALAALDCKPGHWMPAYYVGMIEDRLGDSAAAITHLNMALAAGIPRSRYRLLTRLWLARNDYRQGQQDAAREQLRLMRQQRQGLAEWQVVLQSDQAAPLRHLLGNDIHLAWQLLEGTASLEAFDGFPPQASLLNRPGQAEE